MANSILKKDINRLKNSISEEISFQDLNYDLSAEGILRRGFVPYYGDAITVNYIMWLRSMPGDFIRQPNFGGFFRAMLNRYPFRPESEKLIEDELRSETETNFPRIELLVVEVKCNYAERAWYVKIAIRDKNSGLVGGAINADLTFSAGS